MDEKKFEKPVKLTELHEQDEEKFAVKVMSMVQKSYTDHLAYRVKCEENERYWRNRHWEEKQALTLDDEEKPKPNVPVMVSTIEGAVADAMDSYPDQIVRGINYDDDLKSIIATEILRFTLQRIGYQSLYEKKVRAAYKKGVGTLIPFWNPDLSNGLGDIDARYVDIQNIAWDPNAADVNKGRFFAIDDYLDPEEVYELYPDIDLNECFPEDENAKQDGANEIENIRSAKKEGQIRVTTFIWLEREPRTVDTELGEERVGNITWVNSAVIIGNKVPEFKKHQFKYDRLMVNMTAHLPIDGEPVGLSMIDVFKDSADTINIIEQEIVSNTQACSQSRFLVNRNANIEEKNLLDFSKKIIRGNVINEGAVREFKPQMFSSMIANYKNLKMAEIKDQSGQTDFMNGMTAEGVSSGVGIQSLQQYGDKKNRLNTTHFWADHKLFVKDILKLVKEYYTAERIVRLSRESQDEIERMIQQATEMIQQQQQAGELPKGDARPLAAAIALPKGVTLDGNQLKIDFSIFSLEYLDLDYDIEIIPQRKNPATSAAINNFVQQAVGNGQMPYELGMELIEFEGKERLMKRARAYFDKDKQLKQMAQQLEQVTAQAQQIAQTAQQQAQQIETLTKEVFNQKLKVVAAKYANEQSEEPEGAGGASADEEFNSLQAEIDSVYGQSA